MNTRAGLSGSMPFGRLRACRTPHSIVAFFFVQHDIGCRFFAVFFLPVPRHKHRHQFVAAHFGITPCSVKEVADAVGRVSRMHSEPGASDMACRIPVDRIRREAITAPYPETRSSLQKAVIQTLSWPTAPCLANQERDKAA